MEHDFDKVALETVNKFYDNYANKDIEPLMNMLATEQPVYFLGSDAREAKNLDEARKMFLSEFEKISDVKLVLDDIKTLSLGDVLVITSTVTADTEIHGEKNTYPKLTSTVVLTQEQGAWKIQYMHSSFPSANAT